jgi:hypothetical protein
MEENFIFTKWMNWVAGMKLYKAFQTGKEELYI